ncbi:MAG: MotE family protein [Fidelibacterota bacterium]
MKKIILLIVGGLLFFLILVGLVFGVLSLMDGLAKPNIVPVNSGPVEEDNSILGLLLSEKQTIIDSLQTVNQEHLLARDTLQSEIDSLTSLAQQQNREIIADSLEIKKLEEELAQANNQPDQTAAITSEQIKQMAKTYESMKVSEIKPIFTQLDDETIIALYNNMSSRKRPMVLKALSTDRAAKITKKIIE